jgi:MGT family glycosyltransferase
MRYRLLHWWINHVVLCGANLAFNRERAKLGLGPLPPGKALSDCLVSPYLHLQGTTASFEFPRRTLPRQIHYVGPFLPAVSANFTPPSWWSDLDGGRPVVLVTQGTIATNPEILALPTLRALADADMLVIILTPDPAALDPLPSNVRAESFIPYESLLPHVDVMVTSGGYNGVQMALAHGVPMVTSGWSEDKREIGSRIAWLGVGIDLNATPPTPEQVDQAVHTVLCEPTYRRNAQRLQSDIARHDGPTTAAVLLERLATSGRPVT